MGLYVYATLELLFTFYIPGTSYDSPTMKYKRTSPFMENVDEDRLWFVCSLSSKYNVSNFTFIDI